MKRYIVGVLYYGGIDREHDRCIQALRGHPYISNVHEMHGCPYIDIGRSVIGTHVLDNPDIGGVLFVDHDMIFETEEVTKLIESTEKCQGVVGAAYSMRRPGHMIGGIDTSKLSPGEKVVFFEGGKLYDASYLGMGLTAIHRSVFERLVAASEARHKKQQENVQKLKELLENVFGIDGSFVASNGVRLERAASLDLLSELIPELRDPDLPRMMSGITDAPVVPFFSLLQRKGNYYGEDVSLCIRCHDQKIPVCIDSRVRVYHKGNYPYGLEDCGMAVPYCTTLISAEAAPGAEPQHTRFSPHPTVQAAMDAAANTPAVIPLSSTCTENTETRELEVTP